MWTTKGLSVTENPSANQDVVDLLTGDHALMLDLLSLIEDTLDPEGRRQLADTLIAEVVRHTVAEEAHVYPAVEKHLGSGEQTATDAAQENAAMVEVMKRMEALDPTDPAFLDAVHTLEGQLRQHASDQESRLFPQLRAGLAPDALVELKTTVEAAMERAPTRPRPDAPHSELFHKTIGAGIGMVDRLRDRLTGRAPG